MTVEVTAGQVHESTQFEPMVARFIASRKGRRRQKPKKLAADKGYTGQTIRDWLQARNIEPVIPLKSNQSAPSGRKFDREAYRQRAVVEQAVGWLKEYRRIGTRFEKLALNFHGMLKLAMICQYLRLLFSDRA